MGTTSSYGQFCPVARAAEIVAEKWTPILLRELLAGSTRFSELRKGIPLISPALLSKRLQELTEAGVLRKKRAENGRGWLYELTEAGEACRPLVEFLGIWGQRWIHSNFKKSELDPTLLMWDVRRRIDFKQLPRSSNRFVAQFHFHDAPAAQRLWWLVGEKNSIDLCLKNPGYAVDLAIESDLYTLSRVWMGKYPIESARRSRKLLFKGPSEYADCFERWFKLSPFAPYA